jgi:hypothetical protein
VERRSSSTDSLQIQGRNRRSSPIGLGLPRQLVPENQLPPPVPSKRQSVSSPFPTAPSTRSNSPAHKISFAEPEDGEERGREMPQERRQKVRRARSLSGIFKSANLEPAISTTSDQKEKEKDEKGGVLVWLGVKKTVKRRQSETHLRQPQTVPSPSEQPVPRVPSPAPRVSNDSRKGKSPHGSYNDLTTTQSTFFTKCQSRSQSQKSANVYNRLILETRVAILETSIKTPRWSIAFAARFITFSDPVPSRRFSTIIILPPTLRCCRFANLPQLRPMDVEP